ncbi:MAG: UbiD family decarboxylase [Candidatus Micrarchaeota archaeon]
MNSLRDFVETLRSDKKLVAINKEVSKNLELAGVLLAFDGRPVMFNKVAHSKIPVVGNIFSTRQLVCDYLGIMRNELVPRLIDAMNNPVKPELVESGPVLEVEGGVNLERLPIPFHAEMDGGPYLSSAIVIAHDKELGRNLSFHRMMVIGKDRLSMRILPRHLSKFLERAGGTLDVAVIVGAPINVLLSAAISSREGQDELEYASAISPVKTVRLSNGIEVPADVEFAFEGRITPEMADEGPFIDLTGTYDIVRKQPVMHLTKMYHRKNPIWHALLPGGLEHKVLMGMPREPTIFTEVDKVAECRAVNLTPGGCSWLHAVVSIKKNSEEDGKLAIEAAFRGHKSLKHVVIVDDDIDIDDPLDVEWAIATRFQAKQDLIVKEDEKGSSLDPSADQNTRATSKMGLDATKPVNANPEHFDKAEWKKVKAEDYL